MRDRLRVIYLQHGRWQYFNATANYKYPRAKIIHDELLRNGAEEVRIVQTTLARKELNALNCRNVYLP